MNLYKSTRAKDLSHYRFSEAILQGIAKDGGLLVPQTIPQISLKQLQNLTGKSYQECAEFIFKQFETDFSEDDIKEIVRKAYGNNFDTKEIAPTILLKDKQYILELWHGPTAAFKDMALQLMPLFFSKAALQNRKIYNKPVRYLILVGTSGDTGSAALNGYKDKKDIEIIVFYPDNRVSQLQKLQMVTQEGSNTQVIALNGDFDAVQTTIKEIFADKIFNMRIKNDYNIVLSSANSINWGRLLPQIVYYVSAYVELVNKKEIHLGDVIDVSVPTGNFGNILAAFYAKKMGLPLGKLMCASNENNVLTEFLQTGVYDISKRQLVQTPSPSMDILIASNIERLLFLLTNNGKQVAIWMKDLKQNKRFEVDEKTKQILQNEFYADWVDNNESLAHIKKLYNQTNYLIDPHTSVAHIVAERYREKHAENPTIICATAHWAKFAKDVYQSLFGKAENNLNDFQMLEAILANFKQTSVPKNIIKLSKKPILHNKKAIANKITVERVIIDWIKEDLSS